jgi:hypothetical protein
MLNMTYVAAIPLKVLPPPSETGGTHERMANLGGAVFVSFNCLHYKEVNMKTTIDMAREVKATAYTNRHYPDRTTYTFGPEQLKAFAALVRADERNLWPAEMEAMERQVNILTDALAAEREACAQVVEEYPHWLGMTAKAEIANAIRNRGNI